MNDYKPYKQLKQKQKAKVVERIYKELHQFFSDNQRFPDTPDEHELRARQIFSHIPYRVSFDSSMPYIIKSIPLLNSALQRKDCRNICFIVRNAGRKNRIIPL